MPLLPRLAAFCVDTESVSGTPSWPSRGAVNGSSDCERDGGIGTSARIKGGKAGWGRFSEGWANE